MKKSYIEPVFSFKLELFIMLIASTLPINEFCKNEFRNHSL